MEPMPLPDKGNPDAASRRHPDPLDAYFLAHLETCASCRSTVDHSSDEPGAASRSILSQSALIELLREPAFQQVEAQLQNLTAVDATNSELAPPAAEVDLQIGNYRLLEPIACGGMGTVYRAVHKDLNKIVAVKLLAPQRAGVASAVDRFRREMQALGRFSHPHVVSATDGGEDGGRFYLVMEYVEGLDLSAVVHRLGPLRVADAAELIRQAALGVQAIHRHGLVHRDVKPSNIMLSRDGTVKILDLGLSKFASLRDDEGELTQAGQVLGTKRFMAPEQFRTSRVDSRADLYSLGASLWSLLYGDPPPLPEGAAPSGVAGESEPPASRPLHIRREDVPAELAEILQRFTARAPSDRPGAAGDLAAALQPFCEGSDLRGLLMRARDALGDSAVSSESHAGRTPSSTPNGRTPRRLSWVVFLTVLVGTGALLAVAALSGKLFPDSAQADYAGGTTPNDDANDPERPKHESPDREQPAPDNPGKSKRTTQSLEDRQMEVAVALWVLKQGGRITRHPHGDIRRLEDVPGEGPFRVRKIGLWKANVADADLKQLQRLSMLDGLILPDNPEVTSNGLAHLSDIKTLRWLYLGRTGVDDAGLPHLKRLVRLESLGLGATAVTDAGLASIATLKRLRELQLNESRVTDAGVKHLQNLPALLHLNLNSTAVTDEGLRSLVESAPQIQYLQLAHTEVSDAGVSHLKELRHLEELDLQKTAVTPQGVESLRQALPNCKIAY